MWHCVLNLLRSTARTRGQATRPRGPRLKVEQLEDRLVPSTFTVSDVSHLIKAINAANKAGGSNTITLVAGDTFTLTKSNNKVDGPTGLPVIKANDNLTIIGNGDTIERNTFKTPDFRLFDVALGGSLALENMFLQGGSAYGSGAWADGGAIYNQGTLDLNFVTIQNNGALGKKGSPPYSGHSALGGGVYSNGALTIENGSVIQNNSAVGGGSPISRHGVDGGDGAGGGVYVAGGTASITDSQVTSNLAEGGVGSNTSKKYFAGRGSGGGVYVGGGTVTLSGDTLKSNSALGGNGSYRAAGGMAFGGGLFAADGTVTCRNDTVTQNDAQGGTETYPSVGNALQGGSGIAVNAFTDTQATAYLDAFTQANTINNNGNSDTYGPYTLIT
jgi:hypothetical protein